MDFATPRQFAMDAEIANSDDEGEFLEERPFKRIKTGEPISSTPSLLKQSTLTQIDFVKLMREGIPDSDEDPIVEHDLSGLCSRAPRFRRGPDLFGAGAGGSG